MNFMERNTDKFLVLLSGNKIEPILARFYQYLELQLEIN